MKKKKVTIEIDSDWFGIVDDALKLVKRVCEKKKVPIKINVRVVESAD